MPVKVVWNNGAPIDREEWEDVLRAEYGTAMGRIVFYLDRVPEGFRLSRVEEEDAAAPQGAPRLDQRQRFRTALCAAGKPVLNEVTDLGEDGQTKDATESVSMDALNARTERARREGGAGE